MSQMLGFGVSVGSLKSGWRWWVWILLLFTDCDGTSVVVLHIVHECILQSTSSDMVGMRATLYSSKLNGRRRRATCTTCMLMKWAHQATEWRNGVNKEIHETAIRYFFRQSILEISNAICDSSILKSLKWLCTSSLFKKLTSRDIVLHRIE